MFRPADEEQDVICHQCRKVDGQDVWTIWVAGEKQGERDTLEGGMQLARDIAVTYSRSAWLLDETGYPLKPIEPVLH